LAWLSHPVRRGKLNKPEAAKEERGRVGVAAQGAGAGWVGGAVREGGPVRRNSHAKERRISLDQGTRTGCQEKHAIKHFSDIEKV